MLKDITIGQYYPGQSYLHRLDPRTKLICLIFYMTGLFMIKDLSAFCYLFVFTAMVVALSGIPVKTLFKGIKPMWLLLSMTLILNFFMSPEGATLWQWRFLKITDDGVVKGFFYMLRLIFLFNVTSLLTLTTTPILLTDGLERIMKRCFIPMAHELAMMMTIALRFIPILIEETERIMKAQIARGADFENGGLMTKAKSLIPLLIPLFVSVFRRADDLAMAMEARCYRSGEGRTKLRQLQFRRGDGLAFAATVCFMAFVILDRYIFKLL
jgi:energy-coupling factor transport system permease protein